MTTPARRQYLEIKAQYPDTLLAYQVGDFFEFFDDDAKVASADLQITRPFKVHRIRGRAGASVFNVFNHDNPRDVQSVMESPNFGQFYNDAWREYRGKMVFEF